MIFVVHESKRLYSRGIPDINVIRDYIDRDCIEYSELYIKGYFKLHFNAEGSYEKLNEVRDKIMEFVNLYLEKFDEYDKNNNIVITILDDYSVKYEFEKKE